MRGEPLLAGPRRLPARAGKVAELTQPLARPLVVGEHALVPRQLDELAHRAKRRLRVENQVLVADLEVVAKLLTLGPRVEDPPLPSPRHLRHRGGIAQRPAGTRQRDVSSVPDQVNEPRLADHILDLAHVLDVDRRLVAPPRLALALRVELEQGASRGCGVERLGGLHPVGERVGIEVEIAPVTAGR